MPSEKEHDGYIPATVRRAPYGELTIYEISESELNELEKGPHENIYLNFAIFLLSIFLSFIICLLTTTIMNDRVFVVFTVITYTSGLSGVFLLILWWRKRTSIAELVDTIRSRLPPEGIQEPNDS